MDKLIQKIKTVIDKYKLLTMHERVLAGVSGGPDSVFLLYLLNQLKPCYDLQLCVAHVNHGLRGSESDKDELFVKDLSAGFALPFYSIKLDTKKTAKEEKLCLEDAARRLRYDFFAQIAQKQQLNKIAVAHTKDDQAETVFMRILRGAGLTGLCAMDYVTLRGNNSIIRPLLGVGKDEILLFLKKHKIKSRTDSSNLSVDFMRNKVRRQIFPFLEKFSPEIKNNLFRMSQILRQADVFLAERVEENFNKLVLKKDKKVLAVKTKIFAKLNPALRSGLIRRCISFLKGNLTRIDLKHIEFIEDLAAKNTAGEKNICLPAGIRVLKNREWLVFRTGKEDKTITLQRIYTLNLNKKLKIPCLNIELYAAKVKGRVNLKKHSKRVEYFDADKIKLPLLVRARKKGDVFQPLGVRGEKKLKKFLIDEKIDAVLRDKTALVISGSRIIWVVGVRICEYAKVSADTKRILKIKVSEPDYSSTRRP